MIMLEKKKKKRIDNDPRYDSGSQYCSHTRRILEDRD